MCTADRSQDTALVTDGEYGESAELSGAGSTEVCMGFSLKLDATTQHRLRRVMCHHAWAPDMCHHAWVPDMCHHAWAPDMCHRPWAPASFRQGKR